MDTNDKKYPQGHFTGLWMGLGIAVFSGIGIPLSIITENPGFIGFGHAMGVAVGGQGIEQKYRKAGGIRPQTVSEKTRLRLFMVFGMAVLGVALMLIFLYFR